MKHYLNVCDVNGAKVEPVDIITFGSPCQDLSVAGKRAGMKHESNGDDETTRSGLFMEAVRIIKEMREATNGRYPTFALWENVPGAFSSNSGDDFRVVIEELAKIADETVVIPKPPKGKWSTAGRVDGDGWSIAWRTVDAQYHGVPQRRRRILLVADFRGQRAGEISFKCEGLPGYPAEIGSTGQETAGASQDSLGAVNQKSGDGCGGGRQLADVDQYLFAPQKTFILDNLGGQAEYAKESQVNGTLRAGAQGAVAYSVENHPADSRVNIDESGMVQTLTSRMGTGGGNVPMVLCMATQQGGAEIMEDKCPTITAAAGMSGNNQPVICASTPAYGIGRDAFNQGKNAKFAPAIEEELQPSMIARGPGAVAYGISSYDSNAMKSSNPHSGIYEADTSRTLDLNGGNPACNQGGIAVVESVPFCKGARPRNSEEGQEWKDAAVANTLNTFDQGETRCNELVVTPHGFDPSACRDMGQYFHEDCANTLVNGSCPGHHNGVVYTSNKASFFTKADKDLAGTLVATDYKDPQLMAYREGTDYIVRRLTPTECARLQGFPDWWGRIQKKDNLTDEEYHFWLAVRNTHAEINGKIVKDYTKKQMLTWYNKLWTDSAEYKMWGNGVALPCVRVPIHNMAKLGAKTLGILFDGSGGFPLAGVLSGIEPVWASEIAPYPIAVTVERFGGIK